MAPWMIPSLVLTRRSRSSRCQLAKRLVQSQAASRHVGSLRRKTYASRAAGCKASAEARGRTATRRTREASQARPRVCEDLVRPQEAPGSTAGSTHGEERKTKVRVKQVVAADQKMAPITDENKLPSGMNKKKKAEATKLGAVRVDPFEHEMMLDEIHRREVLEHDEDPCVY
uniref:Uncharacterized protein n=1 Tax=Coccolithus braarudii TaxID=221442 RepID=A0A7S0L856_9EUKA|mmetsp:Transcript_25831/g.55850  ORF Transcript_25831/g.55850 Transcript_25831/m.55850 type:complete len:172 (+) Transcript_25831:160-675(+)